MRNVKSRTDGYIIEVNASHDPEEFYVACDSQRGWSDHILRIKYDDRGNLVNWRDIIANHIWKHVLTPQIVVQLDKKRIISSSALPDGAATEATLLLLKARADLLGTEVTLAALNAKVTVCNTGAICPCAGTCGYNCSAGFVWNGSQCVASGIDLKRLRVGLGL
jgi:hypothetical protein